MIEGVIIKKLDRYEDDRGWLIETHRNDEQRARPAMSYFSKSLKGVVRGPHEHKEQSDQFVFVGPGNFEFHMWDNRAGSATYQRHEVMEVGESNPASILVPPGVVHGYKCLSDEGYDINLPDRLYKGEGKKGEVDEVRHENNPDSPFKIE